MSSQQYKQIKDEQSKEDKKGDQWDIKTKVIYISIVTVLVFVLEVLTRGPFTRFSDYIQENLNFESKCWLGDVFVWFKYKGKAVIFLLLFNISNIYVSLSMITLDAFGIFINGTIKLIYMDPRPFWRNVNLVPCTCATNYGSPSTTGLDVYLVSIVVYRALINRSSSKAWKVLIWIFYLMPQILAWTSRFIQNIHSLPQLTFGLLCGYIIQYVYFEVIGVDMESKEQLGKLVNNTWLMLTIALTLVSWFFFNAIHYYFFISHESQEMIDHIGKYCSTSIAYFLFDNESYQKTSQAFLFIGAILGILIEYNFWFDSNYDKYGEYNMGEARWSDTDAYRTILRMLSMYILAKLILPLGKWGSIKDDSVYSLNLSQNIVPNLLKGIFYFLLVKAAFKILTLSNETHGSDWGLLPDCYTEIKNNSGNKLYAKDDEKAETLVNKTNSKSIN